MAEFLVTECNETTVFPDHKKKAARGPVPTTISDNDSLYFSKTQNIIRYNLLL